MRSTPARPPQRGDTPGKRDVACPGRRARCLRRRILDFLKREPGSNVNRVARSEPLSLAPLACLPGSARQVSSIKLNIADPCEPQSLACHLTATRDAQLCSALVASAHSVSCA